MSLVKSFLIWSNQKRMWWAPNEFGYVHSRQEAGRYSFDEAWLICVNANHYQGPDVPPDECMVPVEPETFKAPPVDRDRLYDDIDRTITR